MNSNAQLRPLLLDQESRASADNVAEAVRQRNPRLQVANLAESDPVQRNNETQPVGAPPRLLTQNFMTSD